MKDKGLINSFQLKIILCALMLLDHIDLFFPGQPAWFHLAARVVAPTFTFLVAEGLIHTRNRRAYVQRMLAWGTGMFLGNQILVLIFGTPIYNTIFISLGLSAALVLFLDGFRENRRPLWLLGAAASLFAALFFEGGVLCPILILLFYYLRGGPQAGWSGRLVQCAAFLAASPLLVFVMGYSSAQHWMALSVIPILLYNGKRGPSGPLAKYFFYLFYPLHIWVLYIAAHLAGVLPS